MINEILNNFFSVQVLIALIVGVVGGMIIGSLPGLSGSMAIALLLPITFSMQPAAGIIMLMAIYTSAMTGGSISAILLHTPGTPANAATALEGYQLTKQGRGLEAIGMSMLSSTFGGIMSALALMIIAPQLSKVSLLFSEPEYFLVAIFGMTIVGSLASDSMIKGLISAFIGLFIATIGMDSLSGTLRYTFSRDELMNGIQMVPAMIGLFSLSQVFLQYENYKDINKSLVEANDVKLSGKLLPTLSEFKGYLPILMLSSAIGTFVGILPGAGGNIGSWISYREAKRISKNKEKFGKGSLEGLCACEAGNNAVTGGAFIPLLTLSIPGSPAAAIILGGLLIHGLVPGNRLFTQQAAITYTILIGFLIANILMGLFGLIISRYAIKVTKLPNSIVMPVVLVLSLIGSYAINTSMFDVLITIIFGAIGYMMIKFKFPEAPMILGLILGGTAEGGLLRSIVMSKGNLLEYYISRPICNILIVLIFLSIMSPVISKLIAKKKGR
ncbi:MAG: tripartite tricarboxylate transporter permease [Peptoniphilus grossensis]